MSRPFLVSILLGLCTGVALLGITRLTFSDNYRSFFQSDDPAYARLEQLGVHFGLEDNTLLVVFDAPDVLAPAVLAAIGEVTEAAAQVDGVAEVYSLFDVPGIVHDEATVREKALGHRLLKGRFLSSDARLMLVVLYLGHTPLSVEETAPIVANVQALVDRATAERPLRARLSGLPAIRVAVIGILYRDLFVFNLVALAAVCLIGLVVFRRLSALVIIGLPPAMGSLWTMGALGWLGVPITVLNSVIAPLVLVIGFADAVHLLTHFLHVRREGRPRQEASRITVRHIGRACALAALTTAIGFGALAVAPLPYIRQFGLACALGVALTFVAVLVAVPLLAATRLGDLAQIPEAHAVRQGARLLRLLEPALARPRVVAGSALLLVLVLLGSAAQLRPDWWYRENLPPHHDAHQALADADEALGGTMPVYALVQWDSTAHRPDLFGMLDEIASRFEAQPHTNAPFSIVDLLRALPGSDTSMVSRLALLPRVPPTLTRRWFQPQIKQAVVTAQVADAGSATLAPAFADLNRHLAQIEARHPGYQIALTGLTVAATETSLTMIGTLARSLALAAVLIFVVIMVMLRSVRLGLVSLLPNAFPLVATAALLVWVGQPLQYASVVVFSIALGIAVDDTIHLLNSFQRARRMGHDPTTALRYSLTLTGRAVIATTMLLVAGFGTLVLSGLPGTRLFGGLTCAALLFALVGDLVLLPAMLGVVFERDKAAPALPETPSLHRS